jgi:hypothetical protein
LNSGPPDFGTHSDHLIRAEMKPQFDWHADPITRATPVTKTYRNTQNVRRFLKSQCGSSSGLTAHLCSGSRTVRRRQWAMSSMNGSGALGRKQFAMGHIPAGKTIRPPASLQA